MLFSASYSRIDSCFTAGKRIWVWNSHATREHWKTTIFTPIVYWWTYLLPWVGNYVKVAVLPQQACENNIFPARLAVKARELEPSGLEKDPRRGGQEGERGSSGACGCVIVSVASTVGGWRGGGPRVSLWWQHVSVLFVCSPRAVQQVRLRAGFWFVTFFLIHSLKFTTEPENHLSNRLHLWIKCDVNYFSTLLFSLAFCECDQLLQLLVCFHWHNAIYDFFFTLTFILTLWLIKRVRSDLLFTKVHISDHSPIELDAFVCKRTSVWLG